MRLVLLGPEHQSVDAGEPVENTVYARVGLASDGFRLKVADAEDALDLLEVVGFVGEVNFSAV